jgi:ribonucleotide monophosphatase NagD (HAD superfamily)
MSAPKAILFDLDGVLAGDRRVEQLHELIHALERDTVTLEGTCHL